MKCIHLTTHLITNEHRDHIMAIVYLSTWWTWTCFDISDDDWR